MKPDPAGRRSAIESALLEYSRSPGKYALIHRQPLLLFSSLKEVLQLASGRSPDGNEAGRPSPAVRQAACFFIRAALLYPSADHYALLGIERNADITAVKDRYRLMMRLMHPDFAGTSSATTWPADAATRVNQAYEVMSSPVRRHAYDEQLAGPVALRQTGPEIRAAVTRPAPLRGSAEDTRRDLKRLATVFGGAGAVALLAFLAAGGSSDKESLVQRPGITSKVVAALSFIPKPESAPVQVSAARPAAPPTQSLSAIREASPQVAAVTLTPPPAVVRAPVPPARIAGATALPEPAQPAAIPYAMAPEPAPAPPRPAQTSPPIISVAAAPVPAPASQLPPPPAPVVVAKPPPPPPPVAVAPVPVAKQVPKPGVTLAQVHPLLSKLLQQMESGWGDRVLSQLDRDARAAPGAQAFLLHYNSLVDGRPVKLSDVRFKAEPKDGRLLVTGHVRMHVGDQPAGAPGKELWVQAEFASRDGTVVMTRLVRAQE